MSLKIFSVKNKKELKDFLRCPGSVDETGSDPTPHVEDCPATLGDGMICKGSSYKPSFDNKDTYFPSEFHMDSLNDVKEEVTDDQELEDNNYGLEPIKFSEYFEPLARITIKTFQNKKQIAEFLMLMCKIGNKKKD